jgi:hypothetical protein
MADTFDGYIRVSCVNGSEGDSFRSPMTQRETIERLAFANGLKLGEVVDALDVSCGKKVAQRELFRALSRAGGTT